MGCFGASISFCMDCFVTSFLAMTALGDSPGSGAVLRIPCRTSLSDLRLLDTLSKFPSKGGELIVRLPGPLPRLREKGGRGEKLERAGTSALPGRIARLAQGVGFSFNIIAANNIVRLRKFFA
jgi:hypothetical protein